MPVLPLVGSISTVRVGSILPCRSASSIMLTPMRSFTLLHGFMLSSLATTSARAPAVTLLRRTSGVRPISSVTSLAIFILSSNRWLVFHHGGTEDTEFFEADFFASRLLTSQRQGFRTGYTPRKS